MCTSRADAPSRNRLFVVATLGTNKRRALLEQTLHDVCVNQGPVARRVVLCHWDSATSWGLQVADYGLWGCAAAAQGGSSEAITLSRLEEM